MGADCKISPSYSQSSVWVSRSTSSPTSPAISRELSSGCRFTAAVMASSWDGISQSVGDLLSQVPQTLHFLSHGDAHVWRTSTTIMLHSFSPARIFDTPFFDSMSQCVPSVIIRSKMSRVFGLVSCAHATTHFIFVTALMGSYPIWCWRVSGKIEVSRRTPCTTFSNYYYYFFS